MVSHESVSTGSVKTVEQEKNTEFSIILKMLCEFLKYDKYCVQ